MRHNTAIKSEYFEPAIVPIKQIGAKADAILIDMAKGQKKLKDKEAEDLLQCLIDVGQKQCTKSFERLFTYYVPRLNSFMRATKISQTSADELAQEVMIKVWRKAHMFDSSRGSVSSWIFTIARNTRTDAVRTQLRPSFDPTDPIFDNPELLGDQKMIDFEQSVKLNEEVAKLPEEQAELIRLSFYEGLSHIEIAQKVQIPIGTVKSRIRLAFGKLRRVLEKRED